MSPAEAPDPAAWKRVGDRIVERMNELEMTIPELVKASGVTRETLNGYIAGKQIKRPDKRRDLCRALRWRQESIDLILRGEEPIVRDELDDVGVAGHGGSEGWPKFLEDEFRALEDKVNRLESRIEEVRQMLLASAR